MRQPRKYKNHTDTQLLDIAAGYSNKTELKKKARAVYDALAYRKLLPKADNSKLQFSEACWVKGLYFLYDGPEIVYIGKSTLDISNRLYKHLKGSSTTAQKQFNKVVVYEIEHDADIHVAEIFLINKHMPKYNIDALGAAPTSLNILNLNSIIIREFCIDSNLKDA